MNRPHLKIRQICVFAALALALTLASARAAQITWANIAGGNWNDAANWNPNQVPGASDDALITASGTYTVMLDTDVTLNSLTLGGTAGTQTLEDPSHNLALNAASSVKSNGLFSLEGGVLAGGGLLTINGKLNWAGGRIGAGTMLTLTSTGVLVGAGGGGFLDFSGTLTNLGTINLTSGSVRCIEISSYGGGSGLLVNSTGGLIDFQADVPIAFYNDKSGTGTPALINRGVVRKSGGSGTSSLDLPLYNAGTLDVQIGTVVVNGGGNGTGVFNAQAGATLAYPADYEVDGAMTGSGTNLLNGGVLDLKGSIAGQFIWVSGRLGTNTTGTVASGGVLVGAGAGSYLDFSGILTNLGTIKLTSGILRCIDYFPYGGGYGLLVNSAGGLIDFQADLALAAYNDKSGFGTPALINQGTVRKSGRTGLSSIDPPFYNSGTLDVQTGSITVHGGGNGKGAFQAEAGATLDFSADYQVDSGLTGAGTNTFSAGTVVLNGNLTTSYAVLSGGVLAGTNGVIADQLTWTGGRIGAGSIFTLAANGVLVGAGGGSYLDLSGILTNLGTIKLASGNFRCIDYFPYGGGSGLLVNAPGGTIDFQADVPISFYDDKSGTGTPALINRGVVRKSGGNGTSSLDVPLFNSGTLDVQSGTVAVNGGGNGTGVFNAQAGGTLAYPANYEVDGTMTGSGTNLLSGGILELKGTVAGQLVWASGRLGTNTTGTVASGGVLVGAGGGANLDFSGLLTNAGTIKLTSGTFRCLAYSAYGGGHGLLVNSPGGLIDFQADLSLASYNDNSGFGTPALINQGTVRKSGGTGLSTIDPPFSNQGGAIAVDSGQLSVGSSGYVQGGGQFSIKLGGPGAGQVGEFITGSSASLGGPLSVSLANGFAPATGSEFQILSGASRTGTFTTLKVPSGISVNYSNAGVFLVVTGPVVPLQITAQPTDQTVALGAMAKFTVTATGAAPLTYRWQANGTDLTDGGNILGSATGALMISNVAVANLGTYAVTVTDVAGSSLTSSNATLTSSTCLPPPLGLVGWWSGDGNATDIIGGNNGTLKNGTTFAAGKVDQAFSLDGVSNYVAVASSSALSPTASFTWEMWVNPSALANAPVIMSKEVSVDNRIGLQITAGGAVGGYFDSGGYDVVSPNSLIQTHQFTHLAYVFDDAANQARLYVNGVPVASSSELRSPRGAPGADLEIGRSGVLPGFSFSGLIDEIGIFNRALSDAEVQSIFNAGSAGQCKAACVTPPTGLVSWWPGDGNPNDIISGDNGTLQGGATFAAGEVSQAFSFNGVDGQVLVPHNPNQNTGGQITIDAWVNPSSSGHGRTILQKRSASNVGGYGFETVGQPFGPDNGLQFYIMIGGTYRTLGTPSGVLTLNTWQHVAATYDGTTMTIYVNGAAQASTPASGTIDAVTDPIVIGRNVVVPADAWAGPIDEVELFNRALSAAEVQAIFNAGSAGQCKATACALTCPANIMATNTIGQCGAIVNYAAPSATGNCGVVTCTPPNGSFFPVGATPVSCTTTGGASCSFTVTVLDKQNPTLTCSPNIVANASLGQTSLPVSFAAPDATDNCPGVTASCTPPSGSVFPLGTTPVLCKAMDVAGNTNTCTFTVTVNSTTTIAPPAITCPGNITTNNAPGQCGRTLAFAPAATGTTAPTVTCKIGATVIASPNPFPVGTTIVSCTASNADGSANCSFTVTVQDKEAPLITCPGPLAVQCDAEVPAPNPALVKATDNCDPAPVVAFVSDSAAGTCPKIITRTYKATDTSGNAATCTQTITVHDTIAPVISGCADLAVAAPAGQLGASLSFAITATDNCDGTVPVTCTPAAGYLALGQTPVTCEAVDRCGNRSSCAFTVTVTARDDPLRVCSFGQGFYGNANGKFNGNTSFTLVGQLLDPGPLVVGKAGTRSLSILPGQAALLQQRMPAGGPPAALPNNGDQTLQTAVLPLNSKGRFADVFLGQTITLSLNVRLSAPLLNFPLTYHFCTQGTLAGSDGLKGTADDVLLASDIQMFNLPSPVLPALNSALLGINDITVKGLLELANRALAGLPTGGASLSDINDAVDAVNRGFDECRAPADCATSTVVADSFNDSFATRPALGSKGPAAVSLQGLASPSPSSPPAAPLNIRVRSSNLDATKDPNEPTIAGNPGGKSVWWQWTAPRTGPVTIETTGSSFDTLLGVFTGTTLSNLALLTSNDDANGALTSQVYFQAQAGGTYQIAVDGANGASGEIVLTLISAPPQLCLPVTVLADQVHSCIDGELGRTYTVEASPDLSNWTLLATALNSDGTLRFADPAKSNFQLRFYRVTFEP